MSNADRFLAWTTGWRHGAGIHTVDEDKYSGNTELYLLYMDGWKIGMDVRREVMNEAAKRFEYKPNILRAQ
jgi:hypothetical protein